MIREVRKHYKGEGMGRITRDTKLSLKAKGLYLVLWELAGRSPITVGNLTTESGDGPSATRAARRDLETAGYLRVTKGPKGERWTLENGG